MVASALTTPPRCLHINLACYGLAGKQCLLQTRNVVSNELIKVKFLTCDDYKALVSSVGPSLLVLVLCLSAGWCYPTFSTIGDIQPSKNLILGFHSRDEKAMLVYKTVAKRGSSFA